MNHVLVQLVLVMGLAADDPKPVIGAKADSHVGDVVTLRDGNTLVGLILPDPSRTSLRIVARREFVRRQLPQRSARWEKTETTETARARRQRSERLKNWRAEREGNDSVSRWIDDEIRKLDGAASPSPLVLISVSHGDVRGVRRGDAAGLNALQLAWSAGLNDPEKSSLSELKTGLESRGLLVDGSPVDLTALLPIKLENDLEWLGRRAATEILHDDGLRFIRYGTLVLPEPAQGAAPSPDVLVGAVSDTIRQLLDDRPVQDPLLTQLKGVEDKKRVGALVTQIEMSADGRSVKATCTIWLRSQKAWINGLWRAMNVEAGQLPPDAGNDLMNDPQVAGIFRLLDSAGLDASAGGLKRQALMTGESARRALGSARALIQKDLDRLDLIVETRPVDPAVQPPKQGLRQK